MRMRLALMGLALVASGCGSSADKLEREAALAKCPPEAVKVVRENQMFLEQSVAVGQTSERELYRRKGIYRYAKVSRDGVSMDAVFLVTNMKGCGWVASGWDTLTPVLVQDDVIVGVGTQTLRDMTAQGWVIKDAVWPWQRYDFGYLPRK